MLCLLRTVDDDDTTSVTSAGAVTNVPVT